MALSVKEGLQLALVVAFALNVGHEDVQWSRRLARPLTPPARDDEFWMARQEAFRIAHSSPVRAVQWPLQEARTLMALFHESHARYAHTWRELKNERGRDDEAPDGPRWSPPWNFHHVLIIRHADATSFLIQAEDMKGRVSWELTEKGGPRQLLPMYCTREVDLIREERQREGGGGGERRDRDEGGSEDEGGAEAVAFLKWIEGPFREFRRSAKERYPESWAEFGVHWSLEEHFEAEPEARPPAGATDRWQPRGSRYGYHLSGFVNQYVVRSSNDDGMTDYIVYGPRGEPMPLREDE
jgi:hypothetical protein